MSISLKETIESYNALAPLAEAYTIPAGWYVTQEVYDLEQRTVFAGSWLMVGRADQVRAPGQYIACEVAGEPILVIRGGDGVLRGFYNVCRHHAAAVVTEPHGVVGHLRCPYHGWTYTIEGQLKGATDLAGICNFDRTAMGLVPVETAVWEGWVFARVASGGPGLEHYLGVGLVEQLQSLGLQELYWIERRNYTLNCYWKVFVDNYLDGGYHVPHLHKGLDSVLNYSQYAIELGDRFCLQWSPMTSDGAEAQTGAVRKGSRALYYWIYPNLMINWYQCMMDTNVVCPRGVDSTEVIFDFYFADVSGPAQEHNLESIKVSDRIQNEDVAICESVQRRLKSRAYEAGRLSVRREAGEHLFHKLLYADLKSGLEGQEVGRLEG